VKRPSALAALAATAARVLPVSGASAEQTPVLVEQHGTHAVWLSAGEDDEVQDPTTYWDLVPLDGMCGFDRPTLLLSDMREVLDIQTTPQGASAGSTTGTGELLDEMFALTEHDTARNPVRVYRGTGDKYADRRTSPDAPQTVDLRVAFRGASDAGTAST
jgi:hypothetical protein